MKDFMNDLTEEGESDGNTGVDECSTASDTESCTENQSSNDDNTAGTYTLKKPFEVDGEMTNKINYDFDSVKPIQYKNLVARLSKKGQIAVPELDNSVQFGYFSLACGIPVSELMRMPSTQDYTVICAMVRNFLLGVSATENEEE